MPKIGTATFKWIIISPSMLFLTFNYWKNTVIEHLFIFHSDDIMTFFSVSLHSDSITHLKLLPYDDYDLERGSP